MCDTLVGLSVMKNVFVLWVGGGYATKCRANCGRECRNGK